MSRHRGKYSRADSEETLDSVPRTLPKQILQSTIKHNYQGLLRVPQVVESSSIRHLYLSHNKIGCLQGIEEFSSLQSINISYNCIVNVQQLRRIANPRLIKHLKMRMNPLPYGYQDYTVTIFPELITFEDIKLDKESKQIQAAMREFVSTNFIQFYHKTETLVNFLEGTDINIQPSITYLQHSTPQLTALLLSLKRLFVFPTPETLRNMSIYSLLSSAAEIVREVCHSLPNPPHNREHYIASRQRIFKEILESTLIKFSARHDGTLLHHLRGSKEDQTDKSLLQAFGRLGLFSEGQTPDISSRMAAGGLRCPLLTDKSVKYMVKQPLQPLINHPMNRIARWSVPQYNSLIPMQETKMYKVHDKIEQPELNYVFQQLPLIIYCKEYLEVITEIVLDKAAELLLLEPFISTQSPHLTTMSQGIVKIQEESINLDLSDTMSFGKQQDMLPTKEDQMCLKTMAKTRESLQERIGYNINDYSIYQINLVFKVFCSLKKRVRRRKRRVDRQSDMY